MNLDDYTGCRYTIWASTPAILWTANRPQEKGIHVHIHDGTKRVVDDTYSEAYQNGEPLSRADLIEKIVSRTII